MHLMESALSGGPNAFYDAPPIVRVASNQNLSRLQPALFKVFDVRRSSIR
jgi:hypothetical protein